MNACLDKLKIVPDLLQKSQPGNNDKQTVHKISHAGSCQVTVQRASRTVTPAAVRETKTALKAVTEVNKEQFESERVYLVSRSVAKSMLHKGIISREEFTQIDTILLEKYHPVLSTLLAGKPL